METGTTCSGNRAFSGVLGLKRDSAMPKHSACPSPKRIANPAALCLAGALLLPRDSAGQRALQRGAQRVQGPAVSARARRHTARLRVCPGRRACSHTPPSNEFWALKGACQGKCLQLGHPLEKEASPRSDPGLCPSQRQGEDSPRPSPMLLC